VIVFKYWISGRYSCSVCDLNSIDFMSGLLHVRDKWLLRG